MAIKNGNGNDNTLTGTANDDMLYGKGGNDLLYGKGCNDLIDGGIGADQLFGGKGDDTLMGGKGADTLMGGEGNDLLVGGKGADVHDGGTGWDTVSYSGSASGVQAYLNTNQSNYAAAGDSYLNVENVIGSAFGDFLQNADGGTAYGGLGDDTLYGGAQYLSSNEGGVIRGDGGVDTLSMNYGQTSAWVELNKGSDIISGFLEDEDLLYIDLSDFGLGNTFDSAEIINSNSITAVGNQAQFIYEDDAKRLWFDANGTGGGGLTLVAEFDGSTIKNGDLGTNDFEFQL